MDETEALIKKASEIEECEDCPLYKKDCPGGWTSDGTGQPVEPPCTSWNDDDEIYEGMYTDYEPSEAEIRGWREIEARREEQRKEEQHRKEIDLLRQKVRSLTGGEYKHIEFRRNGTIVDDWLCPYCHRWVHPGWESGYGGILESWCGRCNHRMVFCSELEREDFQ